MENKNLIHELTSEREANNTVHMYQSSIHY